MKRDNPMIKQKNMLKCSIFLVLITGLLLTEAAFAASTAPSYSLGQISDNLIISIGGLAQLITSGCYVIGFGFGVAAILKFKGHRDNPSQVTIGQPITLCILALAFIFMPMLFIISGDTIFGAHTIVGGPSGVSSF
jgi:intracellular multiplication protein IcmD